MEDPGIDNPISQEPASATEASAEQVELLMGMGFSQALAKKALRETVSTACHEKLVQSCIANLLVCGVAVLER
jgi:uncharacterized UBP type Zn finger protein